MGHDRLRLAGFRRLLPLSTIAALAVIVLAMCGAAQAEAADSCSLPGHINWKVGAANNDWFDSGNWSSGSVPTSSDDVCIQNAPPGGFVSIGTGSTAEAASLESSRPITISSGGLTLSSTSQGSSVEDVDLDGTLGGAGTVTVHGTLNWTGSGSSLGDGATDGTTVIASDGTLAISGSGDRYLQGVSGYTLRINGTANWTGTTDLRPYNSTIEIGSGGKLDAKTNQSIFPLGGTTLLHVLAGGTLTKSAGAGTTTLGVELDNDGTTSVSAGTLDLGGGGTASGQFSIANSRVLNFNNTFTLGTGSTIAGTGTVGINSAVTVNGAHSIPASITTNLDGTLGGAGTVTVHGTLNWTGSGSSLGDGATDGTTVIASDGTLAISGSGDRYLQGVSGYTLRINGTANWTGTTDLRPYNSTIEIGSGGKLDAKTNQSIFPLGGTTLLHVLAGGTLTKSAGAGTTTLGVELDNDGTTSVSAGTLDLGGGGTASGQFSIANSRVLNFNNTFTLGTGSTIAGTGTVGINSAVTVNGAHSIPASITTNLDGTLGGAGTVTVHGTLNWTGSGSSLGDGATDGTTVIASDGTLAISGSGDRYLQGVSGYTLRINGTANWTGTTDLRPYNSTIEIGSGGKLDAKTNQSIFPLGGTTLLHVLAGGTLTKSAGAGTTTLGVELDNDGTTSVSAGTLDLGGGGTASGQFSIANSRVLNFNNTFTLGTGSTIAGTGTVGINSAVTVNGAHSIPASITTNLDGTLGGAGTVTVHGTLNWTGSGSSLGDGATDGTTVIASDGTLAISGSGDRYLQGVSGYTLRINGTANWTGTTDLRPYNSTIEIGSGGKLDAKTNQSIFPLGGTTLLHVLAGGTLTKSAGAGTTSINVPVNNDGTVDVASGKLQLNGGFTNFSGTTLTGGAYKVRNGSTFEFPGADVRTNAADITLSGVGSRFFDGSLDGLRNLQTNGVAGKFTLLNGRNFSRTGSFTNNGLLSLGQSTTFTTSANYTQGAGGTLRSAVAGPDAGSSYGQLVAGSTNLDGSLEVDTSANSPTLGDLYDLVTGTRTGAFSGSTIDPGYQLLYQSDRVRLKALATSGPPNTTITSGPQSTTNDPTPTFTFNSSRPGSTFECKVDGAAFAACSSPKTTSHLADGSHTFSVRATKDSITGPPAQRTFRVDTTPPTTSITSGPANGSTIADNTPSFGFSSNDADPTFECLIDENPNTAPPDHWSPCDSGEPLTPLSNGSHTFAVRAEDPAGNVDQSPAQRTFTVAAPVAPDTSITSGPANASTTADNTPSFGFSSSQPGSSFECQVDGDGFTACSSGAALEPLTNGSHTFSVRAVGPGGNGDPTPASRTFTVNAPPLDTTIASGPADGSTIADPTPTFSFSSAPPGATFECRLDSDTFTACTSPYTPPPLGDGSYTFQVRAVAPSGNIDPTPDSRSFLLDTGPPTYGESVDVTAASGTVTIKRPGASSFKPLKGIREIPVGSIVDTTNGRVRLTSAVRPGSAQTETSDFYRGKFKVREPGGAQPITELVLVGFNPSQCAAKRSPKLAQASAGGVSNKAGLWGSSRKGRHHRHHTRGHHGAASPRGTIWYTEDNCNGTFFSVREGSITVRDFTRHRTVILNAGQHYTAPAP